MRTHKQTIFLDGISTMSDNDVTDNVAPRSHVPASILATGERNITEESDTTGALKQLNNDDIEPTTRMSGIDLRAILHDLEIAPLARTDTLVAMRFLPVTCLHLTRQKKRLSASLRGIGRQQVVDLAAGKREQDIKASGGILGQAKAMVGLK